MQLIFREQEKLNDEVCYEKYGCQNCKDGYFCHLTDHLLLQLVSNLLILKIASKFHAILELAESMVVLFTMVLFYRVFCLLLRRALLPRASLAQFLGALNDPVFLHGHLNGRPLLIWLLLIIKVILHA